MRILRARIGLFVSRIDHYVFRQLLVALVAVTAGLVALIWLTQSLRFVEMVVNRGLSFRVFLELSSLLIPISSRSSCRSPPTWWSSSSTSVWPATGN